MHVFVTGATGFVGTAVVRELLAHDHTVLGLVRSDASASQLQAAGAQPLRGTIEDLDLLRSGAAQADAVIHLAFKHDFSDFASCCATDRAAITAMGDALLEAGEPAKKALVITSGTMMLKQGVLGDEDDGFDVQNPLAVARGASETVCLEYAKKGLKASVVRLPPTTHGPGVSGFMGAYVSVALQKGAAMYVGEGQNHWAAGHRDDAAKVYRLAAEKGKAGSIYHASVEEGVKVKDIAAAVGELLNVPVKSITAEETDEHFGMMKFIALANNLASSTKTMERLEWEPTAASLLDDAPEIVDFIKGCGGEWH